PIADFISRRSYKKLIMVEAVELFEGNKKKALRWLNRPRHALGGITPMQAIKQGKGEEVRRLIGRLEHGVYS
ncbi:MAG: MbcA/ParS/Xre antitoxin family protein, partial [Patescibacteria group bacterium]